MVHSFKALGLLRGIYRLEVVRAGGAGERLGRHASGKDAAEDKEIVKVGMP